jgi:ActR/RegA family two-component response regulator
MQGRYKNYLMATLRVISQNWLRNCGRSAMNLARRTLEQNRSGLPSKVHDEPRILIVCDDNSETARLTAVLRSAGIFSDGAGSIAEGCEAAKSGRFQVVVSTPLLRDGSWRRLTDIAVHYGLGFEVVLWAPHYNFPETAEAMKAGAFDVLSVRDLPKAIEATRRALWAAYLRGTGPDPSAISPQIAA